MRAGARRSQTARRRNARVAQQIYADAILVTNKAVVAPLAPRLALAAGAGEWRRYRRAYRARLLLIGLISSSGVLLLLTLGAHALRLTIGHAGVTARNVYTLWLVIVALAGACSAAAASSVTPAFWSCA